MQQDEISNKKDAETFRILLQIIEHLNIEVNALKAELQKTRDELNTLKGEQGKPKIPIIKKKPIDFSSEKERKSQNPTSEKKSKEKLSKIKIDATEVCPVDKSTLPGDARFKDYDPVVVQEITIKTHLRQIKDNIHIGRAPYVKKSVPNYLTPIDFKNSFFTI